jgi:FkbM family methyltransferase
MKQLYPHAHIYGFEPVPANYIQLERTIALSHLEHTYPFRQGVGGVARQDTLFLHDKNIGGHSLYQQPTGSRQTLTIDLVDLPSVLARMQGNRCDLLKLDCEGAEYEIITHMDKETAARVPRVVFEPSPSLYDPNVLHQHLSAIGYRVEKNQGLYVASLAA